MHHGPPGPPLPPEQRQLHEGARQLIAILEARQLAAVQVRSPSIATALQSITELWQIERLGRFWEDAQGRPLQAYERIMPDLISGLADQPRPLVYMLWSDGQQLHVAFGSTDRTASEHTRALLTGLYPGIRLRARAALPPASMWKHVGVASGIPALKSGPPQGEQAPQGDLHQIERLPRGLARERWAYLIIAEPIAHEQPVAPNATPRSPLHLPRDAYLEAISVFASAVRRTYDSVASLRGDPLERTDRVAQRNVELLEATLQRAEIAKSEGSWQTQVYYTAEDAATFERLLALVRSSFAGDEQAPQPFRTHRCHPYAQITAEAVSTALTSRELARYCTLPREEFPGYQVVPYTRFALNAPTAPTQTPQLEIGVVIDGDTWLSQRYNIALKQLTAHVLIAGTTGSGKTNTCLHLLAQLGQNRVPFLVIEPVNASHNEYRSLARLPAFQQQGYRLNIFTLGDDTTAPFAFNPLEIEPGTTTEAHISRLMTCFKAAMPMWHPLPAVFMRALQRCYTKAGVLPGQRVRAGQRFPTMHDFSYELNYVATKELQHGDEAKANIIGASVLRVQALLEGSAGRLLTSRRSIPIEVLLGQPTIIELKHIGDDSDKALLIALLLMRLTNAMEQRGTQQHNDRPAHVLLIEEAHRLLGQPSSGKSEEQESSQSEAAQAFAQLLAETRKYGQGVIIAEQLPNKLVRDAIGNTGLKLMHLLTSKEDRDTLAAAMRLQPAQADAVASLPAGQCIAYQQGQEAPVQVGVPKAQGRHFKQAALPLLSDTEVQQHMVGETQRSLSARLPFLGCDLCRAKCQHRPLGQAAARLNEHTRAVDDAFSQPNATPTMIYAALIQEAEQFMQQQPSLSPPAESRYCIALHMLYASQGADVDTYSLWPQLRAHI